MWTKIYLIALAVAVLPLIFLYFYAWSWLGSIGAPSAAVEGFNYYFNIAWNYLWIASLILLILANVLIWKTRKSWALWSTLGFFAVFVLVKFFLLDTQLSAFKQAKGFPPESVSLGVFLGVIYVLLAAVIIYFNQFIVLRLTEKMHPQTEGENFMKEPVLDESEIKQIETEQ